ncbi:MAG: TetR/AcrR family transcriptional regulator [Bacteroidetes bacterium]|nr:TetR/AcrR family transcriptional regulator [Bacteroidota bacterium]
MSPRTEKQFEEIRENKKALIMDTALELFASQGYYPTSISDIAQKAGISKGLMYNYFESKEDLIKEIVDKGMAEFTDIFDVNKDGVLTSEEFTFFIDESFRRLKENTSYWKLYFSIILQPPVYEMARERMFELTPLNQQILLNYYKQRGARNPELEVSLFHVLMDGVFMNFIMDPEDFPLEEMKKMIIEKFSIQ